MKPTEIPFVFLGTDEFAVGVLDELQAQGVKPRQIVTTPDQPKGRGLTLTPPPVRNWAEKNAVPYCQELTPQDAPLFVVAAYGRILKPEILQLPRYGVLNIHPSLLPKYRGPSPIQTAILNGDQETGVTIMLCDAEVDHGPTLKAQGLPDGKTGVKLKTQNYEELRNELAKLGARLLLETMPEWVEGKIKPKEQNHAAATYTKKIKKEDGLVSLEDDPIILDRKFRALTPWPGIYFLTAADQPVKITAAHLEALPPSGGKASRFVVDRVIPAGKKEMNWEDFLRGRQS